MSDSLQALVDRSAILSAEVQQRFGALIAGRDFDVDFSAAPRLRFSGDEPIMFRPHMIGSSVIRRVEKTWHWAWDNLNGFPDPVVALAGTIRAQGDAQAFDALTTAELPIESDSLPATLTLAAKALTGVWAHYPVDAGGGTTVWVLIDDARLDPGEPELKTVVRALASAITTVEVSDHHAALTAYAELRGLRTAPLPDGGIRLLCADGSADVTFDEAGRVAECQAHQPLEGEAADQFAAAGARTGTAEFGALEDSALGVTDTVEATASDRPEAAAPVEAAPVEAAPVPVEPVPAEAAPVEDAPAVEAVEAPAQAAAVAEPAQPDSAAPEVSAEKDEPQKKGFFKRLFGR